MVVGREPLRSAQPNMKTFRLPAIFEAMAKALFRPLCETVVREGLSRLYNNVSLGDNGVGAKLYKTFQHLFVPHMLQMA